MPPASDQRALASMLATLDDAALAELLRARGIPPSVSWRDMYDAAEGLLEPAAIERGLAALPAAAATALVAAVRAGRVADSAREELAAHALATPDGTILSAVAEAVHNSGVAPEPLDDSHRVSTPAADAVAAERAFTSAASLADLMLMCIETPLGRIGAGTLGAVDRRRLVEAGAVLDAEDADPLVEIAEAGGLLAGHERLFLVTERGREWLRTTTARRWETLALSLREALPAGLRSAEGGWLSAPLWPRAFPFARGWPEDAERWQRRFVAWGLLTSAEADPPLAEPPWAAPLARGSDPDTAAWQQMLPGEVDRVFLQNDLTAIAPGPLAPALDVRLRTMARRESRAQASSYRFSADTLAAAITAGETAESIRAFLEGLSLTGVPQPLAYVIESTAARHGQVRVGENARSGLTEVSSTSPEALATIAVDQALRPLGLVSDGGRLVSRASRDGVFWALADAKYPVVAIDAEGRPRTLDRARLAPEASEETPQTRYRALIDRLREGGSESEGAWLERELEHAVRARSTVDIVVALPEGATRTFRLEATGLGGGRVRGLDRTADVERTLPLSSIVSVHPVA